MLTPLRKQLLRLLMMLRVHLHLRQACLFCFLFISRSTRTNVCVCQRHGVYRLQTLSSIEGQQTCPICPKLIKLPSAAALVQHMRHFHGGRAYFCAHCRFSSASMAAVVEHRREHNIPCPHCSMLLQAGAPFTAHVITHQKEQLKPGSRRRLALVALQVLLCFTGSCCTLLCIGCAVKARC